MFMPTTKGLGVAGMGVFSKLAICLQGNLTRVIISSKYVNIQTYGNHREPHPFYIFDC